MSRVERLADAILKDPKSANNLRFGRPMRHVSDAASCTSIVVRAETTLAGFARMSVGLSMTPLGRSPSIRSSTRNGAASLAAKPAIWRPLR